MRQQEWGKEKNEHASPFYGWTSRRTSTPDRGALNLTQRVLDDDARWTRKTGVIPRPPVPYPLSQLITLPTADPRTRIVSKPFRVCIDEAGKLNRFSSLAPTSVDGTEPSTARAGAAATSA